MWRVVIRLGQDAPVEVHSSSPWGTSNHASADAAQRRQPCASRARSSALASPRSIACSAMLESTMRSAHMPPHHDTSAGVEKHQTPAVEDTMSNSAASARLFKRRPASGSAPLARATFL